MSRIDQLSVFMERDGTYRKVGAIRYAGQALSFSYAPDYLARPDATEISLSLPLDAEAAEQPASFFEGLLPEGAMRAALATAVHVQPDDYYRMLERVNRESIGALVLAPSEEIPEPTLSYRPMEFSQIESFAANPRGVALRTGMATRLSLSGAQGKLGLFHIGKDMRSGWATPEGCAPTTHILKAADSTFENQMLNESICLRAASSCGLDVAEFELIATGHGPVLSVRRFDRPLDTEGNARRMHQEDFCQAAGLFSAMKYEPSDGHFASLAAHLIQLASTNPFGDRLAFFERLLFDYLVGNCDNHLKNYSFLWNQTWTGRSLSPAYDVSCTTIYPALAREMGIALSPSRRIDDVTIDDIADTAASACVPSNWAVETLHGMASAAPDAVIEAGTYFEDAGFAEAGKVARTIAEDMLPRIEKCLGAK